MRLLTGMTVASVLTAVLSVDLLPAEIAEARVQLEDGGLAIYGRVMRPATREPVVGAQLVISGGEYDVSPAVLDMETGRFSLNVTRTKRVRLRPGEIPPNLDVLRRRTENTIRQGEFVGRLH